MSIPCESRWRRGCCLAALALWSCLPFAAHGHEPDFATEEAASQPAALPRVPKSLAALQAQTGPGFLTARRGAFLVAGDLTPKQFDYVVNGILACCQTALERNFFAQRPQTPVTIYIFKDQESYAAGLRRFFNMAPISPYGHYGHSNRYIAINYQTGPGTLVHELTHALMAPDFPEAPIWISEGMASLFEQCRAEKDALIGEQNWRLPELQKALANGQTTPLRTLFTSDTKNFRLMRESLHYAQCRYFCMYLQEKGVLATVYRHFRDNFRHDPTGVATVEAILGQPLEAVEKDWLAWVATQKWTKRLPPAAK
ncbi:MAG: hypothetical protein J6333_03200 [Planctomycetes bacterium]|nr:hypothetical protein [Planctomycetota bacterium]